jgi:hypothetical protein
LLRRGVLVPAASVVAVLTAAAVVLVAILGGPGSSGRPGSGSGPGESVSPLAAAGHPLASDSPTSTPASGPSTSAAAKKSPAHNSQSATQPNAAAAAAPAGQAAPAPTTVSPVRMTPTASTPVEVPTTGTPTTSKAPAPTETITPFQEIHYSGASTVACSEDGTVASGPAVVHIPLVVTNNTSYTILVYWINLSRALVLNADLLPGQTETFNTDEGDYWMISRSTGACFDIFLLKGAATLTAF